MNVQQQIIRGIRELLYRNDYLVVPSFGGFVLKHKAAHFNAAGGSLMPPSKTVSFNVQLKQNDGLLANWLQHEISCSPAESASHLSEFASFCSSILNTRRKLSFEGIGFFYLDFENNLCFEPKAESNFLADAFGLSPLSVRELPVTVAEKTEVKKEPRFEDRISSLPEEKRLVIKKRSLNKRIVTPALLVVLLLSFFAILLTNQKFSGQLTAAFVTSSNTGVYKPAEYPALELAKANNEIDAYVSDANGIAALHLGDVDIPVRVKETTESFVYSENAAKYEIVVGCFSQLYNARRMITKLKAQNINATLSGKNEKGLYVVSSGKFNDHEPAVEALTHFREKFPKAWLRHH